MDQSTLPSNLAGVMDKIERVRQHRRNKFYLRDEYITLSHGSGGKSTHNLIEGVFVPAFANPLLDQMEDAATFSLDDGPRMAFTTDTYVVSPLFFPGGNIGTLAVHGTINDLAMMGAQPAYLSAGFVLEEGFPIADLRRIVDAMAAAATAAHVTIVTGDTKVVQRGKGDGVFINTAGIGVIRSTHPLGQAFVQPGDQVLVSGPVGDHGITILLARAELDMEAEIESDTAPLYDLVVTLQAGLGAALHCLKDPTRGGLATSLNEIALATELSVALDEQAIPVRRDVRGACEILGLDPLTIANEGRLLAVVAAEQATTARDLMRQHPLGREAAIIGEIRATPPGMVFLRTDIGGTRVLDMLVGDPLPRIC